MHSRIIQVDNNELNIIQDLSYGYAGEVWDAALVLTHFIINKENKKTISFKDKVILELGSGTGICGLTSAMKNPKKVYLTDKEIGLVLKNYNNNKNIFPSSSEVKIDTLNWTKKEDYNKIQEKFDYIICSDIIWNPDLFSDIINVIDHFTHPLETKIILSYQYRKKSDLDFFNRLREEKGKWMIEMIPESELDDDYKADDIMILRIIKMR